MSSKGIIMDDTADTTSPFDTYRPNGSAGGALWVDDAAWSETDLPRRPWLAPGYALRGSVTVVVGPPSAMKSSLMLAWACSAALGISHGDFCPTTPGTVIVYNVEDDQDEQRRRLAAVLRQFDAIPRDIQGKVIRTGPTGNGTLFTVDPDTGFVTSTSALDMLRGLIQQRQAAILVADPLPEMLPRSEGSAGPVPLADDRRRECGLEFP